MELQPRKSEMKARCGGYGLNNGVSARWMLGLGQVDSSLECSLVEILQARGSRRSFALPKAMSNNNYDEITENSLVSLCVLDSNGSVRSSD